MCVSDIVINKGVYCGWRSSGTCHAAASKRRGIVDFTVGTALVFFCKFFFNNTRIPLDIAIILLLQNAVQQSPLCFALDIGVSIFDTCCDL